MSNYLYNKMEAISKQNYNGDTWSQELMQVEIASDFSRAILSIPLIHVGANKKGLFWTKEMIKDVTPMFRGVAFRYDLDGVEGSSHTTNKLSSPHYDVGWTYKGKEGAWQDSDGTMWVKGEVTHPQVIDKLSRETTDGQKEINFASMGVIVEEAKCSICGSVYGTCDHERNKLYNMETAYKVPIKVSKALHVALTNDPADGEAEINDCIFQELGTGGNSMFAKKKNNEQIGPQSNNESPKQNNNSGGDNMSPNENKLNSNQKMNTEMIDQGKASTDNSQIPGGLAPSSHISEQPGANPSPQEILKDLAERVKTIEQSVALGEQTPELINASPQDQFTQDNMGNTTQFNKKTIKEESNMANEEVKDGQTSNSQTSVNPEKTEVQDMGGMDQIVGLLQQILAAVGGNTEVQDMGKESMDASKGMINESEPNTLGHEGAGDMVTDDTAESNKKNKQYMNEPGKVATADVENDSLKTELADLQEQVKIMRKSMELQDNNVPEFGGVSQSINVDIADMTPTQRVETFGEFGSWDACFNGKESAMRFKR